MYESAAAWAREIAVDSTCVTVIGFGSPLEVCPARAELEVASVAAVYREGVEGRNQKLEAGTCCLESNPA